MTTPTDDAMLGRALLTLARQAIDAQLDQSGVTAFFLRPQETPPELDAPGACFVTLTRNGELRGCIGSLEAYRTLRQDVAQNARAAACRDPRFPPVTAAEWPTLRVEVSLLTTPETLSVRNEADLRQQLRPGIDGVILQEGFRRATFLPQVWQQLPEPKAFVAQLKLKAGLPADYWSPSVEIQRYEVRKWQEN